MTRVSGERMRALVHRAVAQRHSAMEGALMKPTRWAATIGFAPTEAKNYLNLTIEYIEEAKNDCHKIGRSAKSSRASRKITQVMTLRRRSADRRGTSALC